MCDATRQRYPLCCLSLFPVSSNTFMLCRFWLKYFQVIGRYNWFQQCMVSYTVIVLGAIALQPQMSDKLKENLNPRGHWMVWCLRKWCESCVVAVTVDSTQFWSDVSDRSLHHHHLNTRWWEMLWHNGVHPSTRVWRLAGLMPRHIDAVLVAHGGQKHFMLGFPLIT